MEHGKDIELFSAHEKNKSILVVIYVQRSFEVSTTHFQIEHSRLPNDNCDHRITRIKLRLNATFHLQ